MKIIRILLVQIVNRNLGDSVISDNVSYLLRTYLKNSRQVQYHIMPYNIYQMDYEMVKNSDMIIFAGGGIVKYKYEKFHYYVSALLDLAQERNIPVFLNAVGIEDYDSNNEDCQRLKKALNQDCVKAITVRDDLKTLQEYYIYNRNIRTMDVFDTAIWSKKCYGIKRNNKPKVIGLGLVRPRIFEDNGILGIDKDYQLAFWKGVVKQLEQQGLQWQVFTNGLKADEDFVDEFMVYMGYDKHDKVYRIPRMVEARQLAKTIASFQGVIACRMHTNIVAYSLRVPSIGIIWNEKLRFWGEKIQHPERFLSVDEMKADLVVARLLEAIQKPVYKSNWSERQKVLAELKRFVKTESKICLKSKSDVPIKNVWQTRLMATALGGKNFLYANMNNLSVFEACYRNGFRLFEMDVRFSADDTLVCVNGWNKAMYQKLLLPISEETTFEPVSELVLKQNYYYGHYETASFAKAMQKLSEYTDITVVLDIGKPPKSNAVAFMTQLVQMVPDKVLPNLIIRVQRKSDVQLLKKMKVSCKLAYYMEEDLVQMDVDKIAKYCIEQGIEFVSMKQTAHSKMVADTLHQYNLKSILFSVNVWERAKVLFEEGADIISTSFLQVNDADQMYCVKE